MLSGSGLKPQKTLVDKGLSMDFNVNGHVFRVTNSIRKENS